MKTESEVDEMNKQDWEVVEQSYQEAQKINAQGQDFQEKYSSKAKELQTLIDLEQQRTVMNMLDNTPIEKFAQVFPGIKLATLQREGITTVGQLNNLISRGAPIPGIGDKVRGIIRSSIANYEGELKNSNLLRMDIETQSTQQGKIVQLVDFLDKGQVLQKEAEEVTAQYQTISQYPVGKFNVAWRVKWFFFSRNQKREYQEQFARYEQFNQSNRSKVGTIQDLANILEEKSLENLWQEFQQSAARFYAFLEKFLNQEIDLAQVTKGNVLSDEILANIQAFQLNTDKLKVSLRGWQEFGAKYALVQQKVLLGDEMGLGKTIEALAVLTHLADRDARYFLVVCPASIMINWMREIKAHSELIGFLVHGVERELILENWKMSGGVAVTTYETLQRLDFSDMEELDALIVDEAHYIKNPAAKRSRRVFELTKKSLYTMYMTGTPIENNLTEMLNLIGELNPEIAGKMKDNPRFLNVELYKKEIAPVYLRRNREDVLTELPELTQMEEWEEFGKEEANIYQQAVVYGKFMLMRRAAWQGKEPSKSPKLNRLMEICEEAKANQKKVIVFSFFKSVIEIVAEALGESAVEAITGSVNSQRRQEILDEFKQNPAKNVLIAQVQAGGVGLNIQVASIVVFCEPQLKPSLETQAIARAYRMGQTQNVFVYRLLTDDSVDERLMEVLGNKQDLFDQYAKDSLIGETAPQAKDISEKSVMKQIVQMERERLLGTVEDLPEMEDEWDF